MKKGSIAYSVLGLAVVLSAWLMNGCSPAGTTPVSMGELDGLQLYNLDSTQFKFTKGDMRGSLMAVVFNPGCEHCQAQAEEFHRHMDQLQDVTIIMIGSVPLQQLRDFSEKYQLSGFKNMRFAYASPVNVLNLWQIHNIPHIVLYDKDLKPVKTFSGPTAVDKLLAGIKK
ncbi:MAG TPA: redoxin domain-containing protein [Cyclobacteriaceae bacterium]|nr:redoxin domain-containing protein [Cyclobacteriaceae bacterium]